MYAQPYSLFELSPKSKKKEKGEEQGQQAFFAPANINEESTSFISKTFFVKFMEDSIPLNDVCHYLLEIHAFPDINNTPIVLQCELMFFDFSALSKKDENGIEKISFFILF